MSQLLLTESNPTTHSRTPTDLCKYITRVFYVPHSCYDVDWILHHPAFRSLAMNSESRVKFYASPKELESCLYQALVEETHPQRSSPSLKLLPRQTQPSSFTHVLACVYSREESMFRWGLVTRGFFQRERMSHEAIYAIYEASKGEVTPVSRAYFKMKAITEYYLPLWGWKLSQGMRAETAIDVGASPGGWSQVLSSLCEEVVAIDPGEVLLGHSFPNVRHLRHMAQAPEVKENFLGLQHLVGSVVCDMNADCRECARILVEHIFPYVCWDSYAILVLTLKLVKHPKPGYIARAVESTKAILLSSSHVSCSQFEVVHLSANSRNERTLVVKLSPAKISSSIE